MCHVRLQRRGPDQRYAQGGDRQGRAIDGDTVSIDVRLLGADAFERKQLCRMESGCWPCGKASQDFTSRLMKGGNATIRLTGTQSYGRPVGTIEIQGEDLGETLIANGLAIPATQYLQHDPARASRYVAAYDKAAASHAGAHRGYFIDPAKWRHGERLSCESKPDEGDSRRIDAGAEGEWEGHRSRRR